MARSSPTAARRSLARLLREQRRKSGLTREQVGEHVGKNPVTITRLEKAEVRAEVGTVAMMLDLYSISKGEHPYLLELARAARKRGWWQRYSKAIPSWFSMYLGLEAEASRIYSYEPEQIPGLLQTEAYARALLNSNPRPLPDADLQQRLAVRLKRQERVTEEDSVKLWIVINEGALYRRVGGSAVMRDQLQHLLKVSERGNVTLQVLPFSVGEHPAIDGPFVILKFPDPRDRDLVYVEYRMGAVYLEEAEELEDYELVFEELKMRSPHREESAALIQRLINELPESESS